MMNEYGKSGSPIVPGSSPNKAQKRAAEVSEGRGLAKGNPPKRTTPRPQGRTSVPSALERVCHAATRDRKQRFTTLLHHVYDVNQLRTGYNSLKNTAAPGIDGETWKHYGEDLEGNLPDLSERPKRGAYRAKPVRRRHLPKPDGRQRPIGLPSLEDKIVQRAVLRC